MIEIHTASAGRGLAWFVEGFDYFAKSAATWLGIVFILLIVACTSALLPLAGLIMQIVTPVLMGGLMLGCREIDNGQPLELNHLFAGFRQNTAELVLLGVFYTIGTLVIMAAMVAMVILTIGSMAIMTAIMDGDTLTLAEHLLALLVIALTGMLLYLPLLMAVWFAPALVVFEGQGAIAAMQASFSGCLKNLIPFTVYGLVGLVLVFVATLPLMLGWLVLMPVTIAGLYIAYRDIFTPQAQNRQEHVK